jgi:catalase
MESDSAGYVRYSDSVEVRQPDEEKTFEEIRAVMQRMSALMNDHYRHAVRPVHAKSHGLLKGELKVNANLPEPLRQGLFGQARSYPVIMRFSTTPGDLLADSVSTPRGLGMKVIGVEGQMLAGHEGQVTQDFVFVNAKTFGVPDAKHFLKLQQILEKNLNDPEIFKKLVSNIARGANAVLGLVGLDSGALAQLGHPETHILGETFGSNAALRYGDYIAKMIIKPVSVNMTKLTGKHVPVNFHYSGLRDSIVEFFGTNTAEWEVGVQLCKDLKKMPVEDPSVAWPEDLSPYQTVGTITALPQNAYSPARRVFVDEILAFSPFHCLAAHRPLGQIMRARQQTYIMTSSYRREMNGRPATEPRDISELPD